MEPSTTPSGTPTVEPGAQMSSPMYAAAIILAIIVIGGIFYWKGTDSSREANSIMSQTEETWQPATTNSDDAASIQAELEATDMKEFEDLMKADAESSASAL